MILTKHRQGDHVLLDLDLSFSLSRHTLDLLGAWRRDVPCAGMSWRPPRAFLRIQLWRAPLASGPLTLIVTADHVLRDLSATACRFRALDLSCSCAPGGFHHPCTSLHLQLLDHATMGREVALMTRQLALVQLSPLACLVTTMPHGRRLGIWAARSVRDQILLICTGYFSIRHAPLREFVIFFLCLLSLVMSLLQSLATSVKQ